VPSAWGGSVGVDGLVGEGVPVVSGGETIASAEVGGVVVAVVVVAVVVVAVVVVVVVDDVVVGATA